MTDSATGTSPSLSPVSHLLPCIGEKYTDRQTAESEQNSMSSHSGYTSMNTDNSSEINLSRNPTSHDKDSIFRSVGQSTKLHDPLKELLDDVLYNSAISPEYDTGKSRSTMSILKHQSNDWVMPVDRPEDINTLQTWLEQLSANIQTNSCIYPEITSSPSHQDPFDTPLSLPGMMNNLDFETTLYSNIDSGSSKNGIASWSWEPTPEIPCLAPSNLSIYPSTTTNDSPDISVPSSIFYDGEYLPVSAKFWNTRSRNMDQSYVDQYNMMPAEEPSLSEPIDFKTPSLAHSIPSEQYSYTNTDTKEEQSPYVSKIEPLSCQVKKDILHSISLFNSPGDFTSQKPKPVVESKPAESLKINVAPIIPQINKEPASDLHNFGLLDILTDEPDDLTGCLKCRSSPGSLLSSRRSSLSGSSSPKSHCSCASKEETPITGDTSPYADLVNLLRDMSCHEEDDTQIRSRHVQIVNQLWEAAVRSGVRPQEKKRQERLIQII
ncbi:hypothetical protein CLU79DRAFT_165381 [Phycomyces nitens]|nr:hypothetical protein CLU79DRAFT_165381 [Phycomyces nitens]